MGALLAGLPLMFPATHSFPSLLQGKDHPSEVTVLCDTFWPLAGLVHSSNIDIMNCQGYSSVSADVPGLLWRSYLVGQLLSDSPRVR
jgi:hypothetical protein